MNAPTVPSPVSFGLYDHEIKWQPFAGIDNLELSICNIDEERQVIDLIVRFAPNEVVAMHNHIAQTNMFIIQGELRMYEPDGSTREVRPAGRYYEGRRDDVHSEGGGPDGAVVLYSIRGHGSDDVFEIMDDDQNVLATLYMNDVRAALEAQTSGT
jgi:quercetin dioxygenase-like cupin family protein